MVKILTPTETKNDPLIHRRISKQPVNTDSIYAMTPETDKQVFGTFMNVEYPGQPGKVSCKIYRGMQYFNQTFEDQKKYKIPLSVARFINEDVGYEQHSYIQDAQGNPIKSGKKTPRYKFMVEMVG